MKTCYLYLVAVLVALFAHAPGVFCDEDPEGSGPSYWGEIPPETEESRDRAENNRRPLWESLIYYPYQVVALPVRSVSWGASNAAVWLSRPGVYHAVADLVTLEFLPIQGRVGVNLGGGNGLGASYSLTHPRFLGPDNRFKLGLRYTTERNSKATLGVLLGQGRATSFEMGGGYRSKPNSRFYGLSHDSTEDQLSYYTNEVAWLGGELRRELGNALSLEASAMYSTAGTRGPMRDRDQALEAVFPGADGLLPGYGNRSDGYTLGLGLQQDTTDQTGRPRTGRLSRLSLHRFTSDDGTDVQFWSTRAEVQKFLPLWHTGRTLALRGLYSRLHPEGNDPLPFQRLMTNDDPDLMRGFHDQRFRDTGLLAFTVEYRFPAWNYRSVEGIGLDAYLFWDGGQVFAHRNEIALRNLSHSYGAGFRFITPWRGFGGRLEVGFSDEDTVIRIGAEQTFQFAKGGLLHGRNPIPTR